MALQCPSLIKSIPGNNIRDTECFVRTVYHLDVMIIVVCLERLPCQCGFVPSLPSSPLSTAHNAMQHNGKVFSHLKKSLLRA